MFRVGLANEPRVAQFVPAASPNLPDDAKLHGLGGGARVIVVTFFGNVKKEK
jgi:hypothetical protein